MKILCYGGSEKPGYTATFVADALNRSGHYCHNVEKALVPWCEFRKKVKAEKPGAVLLTKIPEVTIEEFKEFREEYSGKIIFWSFDYMRLEGREWYLEMAALADLSFSTDGKDSDNWYKDRNVKSIELHQAAAPIHDIPKSFTEEDKSKFSYDVVFLGMLWTDRRKKMDKMLSSMGISYKQFGHPNQIIHGEDFAKVCYLSKIIIGDNCTNEVAGYWSNRVYVVLGCGGFFLASYVPGLEAVFKEGKHLAVYNGLDEMKSKVEYYLPREGTRKAIALGGYQHVRQHHTYDNRMVVFNKCLRELQ